MRKIKVVYFDVLNDKRPEVIDINIDTNDDFHKLLNCETVNITTRSIGGKKYAIVCDDVGAIKFKHMSVFGYEAQTRIFGNVIIANAKGEDLDSLSLVDVVRIFTRVGTFTTNVRRPIILSDY